MSRIKKDFSLIALLLIPVCVAINIVGFQLCQLLRLPIFLDSIGTITAGALAGPWVGAVTGIITNAINGIFNPVYFAYTPTSIVVGLLAGFLSSKGMFTAWWKTIVSGLAIMLASTICSGFITAIVFGGATGGTGSVVTATLMAAGSNIFAAVFSVQVFQEITDKMISVIIFALVMRGMSERYLSKLRNGHIYIARLAAVKAKRRPRAVTS
jgi:energy-coupling factor transport system substrate-specific component